MSSFSFDLHRWCDTNGFKIADKLIEYGVSDPEDLKNMTEDDLIELGIDKPFIRKRFFIRANEEYEQRFKGL